MTSPSPVAPPAAPITVAVVGAGPRGVTAVGRLLADRSLLAPGAAVTVHVVDAAEVGAGRTWRRDQSRHLLNNTYAAETTVFTDESTPVAGEPTPGPDLARWAAEVAPSGPYPEWLRAEARALRPWSYPSRPLQGAYYRWALDRFVAAAAARGTAGPARVVEHVGRAVRLDEDARGRQRLELADGTVLHADTVILAQGLEPCRPGAADRELAERARRFGLTYLPPAMPSEVDWDALPAGRTVVVRGLGANFFDLVGVLFEARGGRFERDGAGVLGYRPSGREPHVVAGSRRGLPYRGKAYYATGLPEDVPLTRFTDELADRLVADHGGRHDLDFGTELWPVVLADFRDAFERTASRLPADDPRARAAFDWTEIVDPARARAFAGPEDWAEFVGAYFAAELGRVHDPERSPVKAVHRAMETARRRLARLVLADAFTGDSFVDEVRRRFFAEGLIIASGPPPERLERLAALVRAGFVELLGPGMEVEATPRGFRARASLVPGREVLAPALAEARMGLGDLTRTDDPLVAGLLASGAARLYCVPNPDGSSAPTRTLDVTREGFRLVDAAGRAHPRRLVIGPTAGDVQWGSAVGATPHTGSPLITGAEAVAAAALRNGPAAPTGPSSGQENSYDLAH